MAEYGTLTDAERYRARKNKYFYQEITDLAAGSYYWFPEVDNVITPIDLYGFSNATVYVYADQGGVAVEVQASFDEGTTFYSINGKSIAADAFVSGKWNEIDLDSLTEIQVQLIPTEIAGLVPTIMKIGLAAKI